jgi:hypothetical protein
MPSTKSASNKALDDERLTALAQTSEALNLSVEAHPSGGQ